MEPSTAAQILAPLAVALGATVGMLALAIALGAKVSYDASLVWTVPLAVIAALTAVSLGFAIAGWMATPESANQLNIAFSGSCSSSPGSCTRSPGCRPRPRRRRLRGPVHGRR